MTTIAFLACKGTLPSAGERRGDAFEHDLTVAALEPAFASQGLELRVLDWEDDLAAFDGAALAILGTAWDYQDKAEAFLARLEELAARGIAVCNPPELVRWNMTKTYLRELEERGAPSIPTLWQQDVGQEELSEAFDYFGCERLVVKRQVGAGAQDQIIVDRGNLPAGDWQYGHRAMLQPFLPTIADAGELSFIFIDGEFSHALRKQPAPGDYRVQSLYGGTERIHQPNGEETSAALWIVEALPFATPLYARIDMLRGPDGGLMVMEAELIEPYLYPEQGPDLGERMARAVLRRLAAN